ncbi:MAG: PilZ domain-containing protein [Treponema sp.]|jgi:hypothetical protein|nr:PilZ domain-containing protein [Treponema sp.]
MPFFKSKSKSGGAVLDSQAVVTRAPRYDNLALVSIDGYEGVAVLRNISQSGFRLESKTFVDMESGSVHTMQINPEASSGLKPFEIKVEVRWIQITQEKFSMGLMIIQGESRVLHRYIEFLKGTVRAV